MHRPDDKWRDLATRLIADTALLDRGFERDSFGDLGPSTWAPTCWKPAGS
jgi:hypothetical protein